MIFDAFISRQDGSGCLTAALGGLELRPQTALAGVRTAESSGRDVGNLVAALTKAGKLKLVAQSLSQEERRACGTMSWWTCWLTSLRWVAGSDTPLSPPLLSLQRRPPAQHGVLEAWGVQAHGHIHGGAPPPSVP